MPRPVTPPDPRVAGWDATATFLGNGTSASL